MFAEECPPEEKLPRQGLRAGEIAIGLHPHTADRLPASLGHALFDGSEELGIVLSHEVVELRLALGEVIIGEFFHQPQHGVEAAPGLAADLVYGPQPGHVQVSVAGSDDGGIQRVAGCFDLRAQRLVGARDAVIEPFAKWLAGV